jgi:hypothetical protein
MLGACFLLGEGMIFAANASVEGAPVVPDTAVVVDPSEVALVMEAKPADPNNWTPVEPAKDAKPTTALLMNKGAGNDALIIKSVSVCDANNVWCVANDGSKDGIYQLTAKGLERKFDGVFVSAGKEIVTVINDAKEVFVLKGGTGSDWTKIEGLKLSRVSRPSEKVGWGLLETATGVFSVFQYKDEDDRWVAVKNLTGADAKGIVAVEVNAEEIALMLTDKGEILKRDLEREELHEKAKVIAVEMKKEAAEKKAGKDKRKGKGKKGKGKDKAEDVSVDEQERKRKGKGKKGKGKDKAEDVSVDEQERKGKGKGKKGNKAKGKDKAEDASVDEQERKGKSKGKKGNKAKGKDKAEDASVDEQERKGKSKGKKANKGKDKAEGKKDRKGKGKDKADA